jgi:hypothetical protein
MLAADLELRGASRVTWIEKKYFFDHKRTLPEVEAALLALSVQAKQNAAVPRDRVIRAYRVFIGNSKPIAGFVAPYLAQWNYWNLVPEYMALLKSGPPQHPASR